MKAARSVRSILLETLAHPSNAAQSDPARQERLKLLVRVPPPAQLPPPMSKSAARLAISPNSSQL